MKRPRAKPDGHGKEAGRKIQASNLSPDEHALWTHVAGSVTPIRTKQRVTHHDEPAEPVDAPQRRKHAHHADVAVRRPAPPAKPRTSTSAAPTAALADFDSRKVRRIAKGRTQIEARLDLHGMRQHDAHARLRHFLLDCHYRGLKHVLVITGKGRAEDDGDAPFSAIFERPSRGVLRRNVPLWLAEPELRAIVVGFTQAAIRHGGDGALYVEIRRRT